MHFATILFSMIFVLNGLSILTEARLRIDSRSGITLMAHRDDSAASRCRDALPNGLQKRCNAKKICPYLAKNDHCNKRWISMKPDTKCSYHVKAHQRFKRIKEYCQKACNVCADGNWGKWTDWSSCSKSSRSRSCNNPKPKGVGKKCSGRSKDSKICNKQSVCIPTTTTTSVTTTTTTTMIDLCASITCAVAGETCQAGTCMCGTGPSCDGNAQAPTCDAANNQCLCGTAASCENNLQAPTCDLANNQCICGTVGMATAGCTVAGETCEAGTCMCGTANSCEGSTTAPTCDAANNLCICGNVGIETSGCTVADETCTAGVCMCGTAASCEGSTTAPTCDAANNQCISRPCYGEILNGAWGGTQVSGSGSTTSNAEECGMQCCSNNECKLWVWGSHNKICHLKKDNDLRWYPDGRYFAAKKNLDDCESTFTCIYNKSQYGHDLARSKESSKKACSEKCCANNECIGFDWDENSTWCWLSKTPWSTVPLTNHNNRYACELKDN